LKDLQGSSIPVLLDPTFTLDEEQQGRLHGLVISWVESQQAGSYRMLPTDALQDARRILVAMHSRSSGAASAQRLAPPCPFLSLLPRFPTLSAARLTVSAMEDPLPPSWDGNSLPIAVLNGPYLKSGPQTGRS
jgi:hypothetical protein